MVVRAAEGLAGVTVALGAETGFVDCWGGSGGGLLYGDVV